MYFFNTILVVLTKLRGEMKKHNFLKIVYWNTLIFYSLSDNASLQNIKLE